MAIKDYKRIYAVAGYTAEDTKIAVEWIKENKKLPDRDVVIRRKVEKMEKEKRELGPDEFRLEAVVNTRDNQIQLGWKAINKTEKTITFTAFAWFVNGYKLPLSGTARTTIRPEREVGQVDGLGSWLPINSSLLRPTGLILKPGITYNAQIEFSTDDIFVRSEEVTFTIEGTGTHHTSPYETQHQQTATGKKSDGFAYVGKTGSPGYEEWLRS